MGYKKRYKTKGKSKGKSKNYQNHYQVMVSDRAPFARRYVTKLKYADRISIDPTIGINASQVMSLNNIFDPNVTGTGHQPMGRDEMFQFYDHAIVLGTKWKGTFAKTTDNPGQPNYAKIGWFMSDTDKTSYIAANSWTALAEQADSQVRTLGPPQGSRGIVTTYGKVNPNKYLGKSKGLINDRQIYNSNSGGPGEQVFLNFFIGPNNAAADLSTIELTIEMEFVVMFFEPKILNQS